MACWEKQLYLLSGKDRYWILLQTYHKVIQPVTKHQALYWRRTRNTNSKQCRHSSHPGDTHQRWTHFPGTCTSCPQQEVTERVPTGAGEPPPLHPRGCHLRTRQEEMLDCFRSGEGTFLECKSYIVPPVNQFDGCDW